MEINKGAYNTVMWTIIAILAIALTLGFLLFKRNLFVTIRTGKELKELKDEFEAYRQSARIAREKMSMDHFNEMQRLKGK
jgi:ribose/xylose/arabinose/galactoside ABC-type transport system permease subunit